MTFRRIDSFATDNPEKLADQLSRLEDNITRALGLLEGRLTWDDWLLTGPVPLAYGRVARVDTSVAVAAIGSTLPSISTDTRSQVVGVVRRGTQNITISPVESTALIDGAASVTLSANGLYLYMHDGELWYRV